MNKCVLRNVFGTDSDKSKENVDANISGRKGSKTKSKESDGEPKKKRRRIILHSDSESGDDYKPGEFESLQCFIQRSFMF